MELHIVNMPDYPRWTTAQALAIGLARSAEVMTRLVSKVHNIDMTPNGTYTAITVAK
jgi:hypothetical protein